MPERIARMRQLLVTERDLWSAFGVPLDAATGRAIVELGAALFRIQMALRIGNAATRHERVALCICALHAALPTHLERAFRAPPKSKLARRSQAQQAAAAFKADAEALALQ